MDRLVIIVFTVLQSINPVFAEVSQAYIATVDSNQHISQAQLPKWRAALLRAKKGGGFAKIACVGDSITWGVSAGSDAITNAKANSWPSLLAQMLTLRGVPASSQSFLGQSTLSSTAQVSQSDPRLTVPASWRLLEFSIGGALLASGTASAPIAFTPTTKVDTFDVYYVNNATLGTLSAQIDNGNAFIVNTGSAGPIGKLTLTAVSAGTHTLHLNWQSGGVVFVIGADAYNSKLDKVHIWNLGVSGSTAANWVSNLGAGNYAALNALQTLAPDLTIISLGANEWLNNVSPATYVANMQTIIDAARATGDVILVAEPPSRPMGSATPEAQFAIYQAVQRLALVNHLPLVDIRSRWMSEAKAVTYYGDAIHPNRKGYDDMATIISKAVIAP